MEITSPEPVLDDEEREVITNNNIFKEGSKEDLDGVPLIMFRKGY
tara:strand:- start:282 stop:416 length:135 start_codon:yes stop_codon:yes gene_type:complete